MLSPESNRMACWDRISAVLPANTMLAMRVGDFFEFYNSDAKVVHKILDVALTKRNSVPMCGIPYHQENPMFTKLTYAGYNVALALKDEEGDWYIDRLARSSNPKQHNYEVQVTETRAYRRTFFVTGSTPAEVTAKAEKAEYTSATEGTLAEVVSIEVTSTPKQCP